MLKSPFFLVSRRLDFDFLLPLVGSSKSKHNSHMKTARQKTFSFSQSPVHLPPLGSPIYGKRAVIQGVSILENRFRNGFKMTISPRELQRANQISNFEHMSVATPRCVPKEGMVTTFARTLKCNTYKRGPTTPFNIVIAQPYYWTSLPRESCAAKPFRICQAHLLHEINSFTAKPFVARHWPKECASTGCAASINGTAKMFDGTVKNVASAKLNTRKDHWGAR